MSHLITVINNKINVDFLPYCMSFVPGLLRVQKILSEVSLHSQIFMFKLDPDGDNRRVFFMLS